MAAKEALKRLFPDSTCSGWSTYGELSAEFAKKPRNVYGSVTNIATVASRLTASRRCYQYCPGSSELCLSTT